MTFFFLSENDSTSVWWSLDWSASNIIIYKTIFNHFFFIPYYLKHIGVTFIMDYTNYTRFLFSLLPAICFSSLSPRSILDMSAVSLFLWTKKKKWKEKIKSFDWSWTILFTNCCRCLALCDLDFFFSFFLALFTDIKFDSICQMSFIIYLVERINWFILAIENKANTKSKSRYWNEIYKKADH